MTYLVDNDNPKPLSLMLERRGLFGWKLTRIDLPLNDIEDAASSKPSVKPSNNNETAIPDQSAEFPKIADVAGDVLPTEVKQCGETNVKRVGNRLEDGNGTPVADSGSAIEYTNGGSQVSYDQIPGIDNSKSGDQIRICLTSIPQHCPPGDSRGRIYHAINHRTGEEWDAPDAEHSCGGA